MHIRSKHQKLILQCYPPGRGIDKRPNSSELSYLLYYASTRRTKLTKVGLFLEVKAINDVYKGRSGYVLFFKNIFFFLLFLIVNYFVLSDVQVTLDIIKALIEKTHEDLNLFAKHVVAILYAVLTSNDLSLCQHASPVLQVFCHYHDGALFSGDPEYVQQFHDLVEAYVSLTKNSHAGPNAFQWNLVGLEALKSIASSVAISTPTGLSHIHKIIPVVLSTLATDKDGTRLLQIDSHITPLTRRESRRFSVAPEPPALTGEPLLLSTCMGALKHFYDTTSNIVLKGATITTLAYVRDNSTPLPWASTLLVTCAKWVPTQIRFTVVTILVEKLISLAYDDIKTQNLIASLIHALLSSSANMIGLSVIDVQRTLLHHQATILKTATKNNFEDGSPSLSDLVSSLRACIVALASHIYYATQVPDMLSELLFRFQDAVPQEISNNGTGTNTPVGSHSELSSSSNSFAHSIYISNILKTITKILALSSNRTSRENMALTLSSWDGTQKLLNHSDTEVRTSFANTLLLLLHNNTINAEQVAPLNVLNFRVTSGPVGRIISELYNLATRPESILTSDYLIIYHIGVDLSKYLSINGAVRVAALAFNLQESAIGFINCNKKSNIPSSVKILHHGIALSCISLALFDFISHKYNLDSLSEITKKEIKHRKSVGLWHPAIDLPIIHKFMTDVYQKTTLLESTKYSIQNPTLVDSILYPSKDDILKSFAVLTDVPQDVRLSIVEPLPPPEGEFNYSSVPISRRASSEQFDIQPTSRARSLRQLNYNARILPAFFVGQVNNNSSYPSNTNSPDKLGNGNIEHNGTSISLNDVPIDSTTTVGSKDAGTTLKDSQAGPNNISIMVHDFSLAQTDTTSSTTSHTTNEDHHRHSEPNGDLKTSFSSPNNLNNLGGGGGNGGNGYLHPNFTGGGFDNGAFKVRTAQSYVDVRRELSISPKVKDLKKAASGYRLPYTASPIGQGHDGGVIIPTSERRGYAHSVNSTITRNSEFEFDSRSTSDAHIHANAALNTNASLDVKDNNNNKHLHPSHTAVLSSGTGTEDRFDVASFLSNISLDPVHEKGKLF